MALFDNRYELEHLLGRGAFAEVWRAKDQRTGVTLALKIYAPSTGMDDDGIEGMTHEFSLLVNANHQNLLRPMYFDICDRKPYLVLPYCAQGNISNKVGKFTERETWKLLRDVAAGLAYLHAMKPPVIHQDIKPANILVADDGTYMITDFGVSTSAKSTLQMAASKDMDSGGTIAYMAPERFSKNNRPIMANDIFSLGCMAYEMLVGELPFGNHGGLLPLNGAEVPDIPNDVSQGLKDIIAQCLSKEPWDRPHAGQLEEIAIQALSNAQTAFVPKSSEAPAVTTTPVQPTVETTASQKPFNATVAAKPGQASFGQTMATGTQMPPSSYTEPIQKNNSGKMWIALLAAVIVVGGAAFFFLPSSDESAHVAASVTNEQPVMQETSPSNPDVSPVDVRQPEPVEEPRKEQAVLPEPAKSEELAPKAETNKNAVAEKKTATEPNKTSAKTTAQEAAPKKQSGPLDLGYATWSGPVKNGKPNGEGTLTFKQSHIIESRDPDKHTAQAGERVEGMFTDGHLEYGTWYKTDGTHEYIMIGS